MATIAMEFVPPTVQYGTEAAWEEVRKLKELMQRTGLDGEVNTLMVPQIIPEDDDRPVPLEDKMDPLELARIVSAELPVSFILTQVTVLDPMPQLEQRVQQLLDHGVERLVFVGVSRVLEGKPIPGCFPTDAMVHFRDRVPSLGSILIPTRPNEVDRFKSKLESGATFALTQMLFSDYIGTFLQDLARATPERPEILLSIGYPPQRELEVGLLKWLVRDDSPQVKHEMEYIDHLAGLPFKEKQAQLVDLYRRVVECVREAGFPVGLHFECPYGLAEPAFQTFQAMLDTWRPD